MLNRLEGQSKQEHIVRRRFISNNFLPLIECKFFPAAMVGSFDPQNLLVVIIDENQSEDPAVGMAPDLHFPYSALLREREASVRR